MRVCAQKIPQASRPQAGQRVFCWRHGPERAIPEGGRAPLETQVSDLADEA
jgi:hypothetical protein